MEDGVTEDEQRAGLSSPEHSEDREREGGRGGEEGGGGGGGFISHLISNFVHEKGTEEEEEEEDKTEQSRDASAEEERLIENHHGEDEKEGGGLIGHLITSFVSSHSPREGRGGGRKRERPAEEGDVEEQSKDRSSGVGSSEAEGGSGNTRGGVIGNLISSILHHPDRGAGGDGPEAVGGGKGGAVEEVGNGGGGGIIENIVAHFPSSFPEDAAPTSEEASFLLHSIVRD